MVPSILCLLLNLAYQHQGLGESMDIHQRTTVLGVYRLALSCSCVQVIIIADLNDLRLNLDIKGH